MPISNLPLSFMAEFVEVGCKLEKRGRVMSRETLQRLYEFAYGDAEESFTMPLDEVVADLEAEGIDSKEVVKRVRQAVGMALAKNIGARKESEGE